MDKRAKNLLMIEENLSLDLPGDHSRKPGINRFVRLISWGIKAQTKQITTKSNEVVLFTFQPIEAGQHPRISKEEDFYAEEK
jgi:hypothetical protein